MGGEITSKRVKVGNFYIDWSDFPKVVGEFIEKYPADDRGGYRLIPMREVVRFIMKEFGCTKPTALVKLRALCAIRRELEIITLKNPDRGVFAPRPITTKYVKVRKRSHW